MVQGNTKLSTVTTCVLFFRLLSNPMRLEVEIVDIDIKPALCKYFMLCYDKD